VPSRARLLTVLALLIPLGLATQLYEGPGVVWVRAYVGALCYEIFWLFALKALLPQVGIFPLAAGIFLVTSALELLQLSHDPRLEWVRSFTLGRVLIGNTFDPWDIAYYAVGSAIGILLYRLLTPDIRSGKASKSSPATP